MKKLFLICLVVPFTFMFSFSQGIGSNPELPVMVPPSPEAYALGKYGEIDVNESTGSISPSIPLYTYKAGNISVPISLAYSGNGVKVDQRPTRTGINWNLIAGGAITRQVRDIADEIAYNSSPILNRRKFYSTHDTGSSEVINLNSLNGAGLITAPLGPFDDTEWSEAIEELNGNSIDSEVDIFNYNFLGYSGSFYIDENWEPQLIKHDKEIDIDISNIYTYQYPLTTAEITITTSDGVKYLFGGDNDDQAVANSGAEYTSSDYGSAGTRTDQVLTSFYLTKITSPNGDTVNFEYDTDYYYYMSGKNQSFSVQSGGVCGQNPAILTYATNIGVTNSIINKRRILSEITSSRTDEIIEFNRVDSDEFKKTLEEVIVKKGTSIIKKYDLDYYYPTNLANQKDKFFLKSVDEQNSIGQSFGKIYTMIYDEIESLPEITQISTDIYPQDHYGYYNGKNNSNLAPKGINTAIDGHFLYLADKEPVFDLAKRGSLKSITYPTGGSTHFEYECGEDLTKPIASSTDVDELEIYYDHYNPYSNTTETLLYDDTIIQPTLNSNGGTSNPATQTVSALYTIDTEGTIGHNNWVTIIIKEQNNSNIIETEEIHIENEDGLQSANYEGTINFDIVEGTNYEVTLKFTYNGPSGIDGLKPNTIPSGSSIFASLTYEYALDTPPTYADALGIRVKSITNKLADDSVADYKRYYYNTKEKVNCKNGDCSTIENPEIVFFPKYFRINKGEIICSVQGSAGFEIKYFEKFTVLSNSLTSMFIDDSSKKLYPIVTVSYGGDEFENGGKEMEFIVERDRGVHNYIGRDISSPNRTNASWGNGTKLKEEIFKKDGISYTTLKETSYNYRNTEHENIISSKIINTIIQEDFPAMVNGQNGTGRTDHFNIGIYETFSRWHGLESIVTNEYFGNEIITTTQTFDYEGDLAGLPTHEITSGSDGLKTLKRTYYPDEIVSASYLGHDNLATDEWNALNKLKKDELYRISEPVQVEIYTDVNNNDTFESNELLNTQRTIYSDTITNSLEKIYPVLIETAKEDNSLESRITYHSYYENGNVKELSKTHGASIVYVWGYDEQVPIAKIENATFNSGESNTITSSQQTLINNAVSATLNETTIATEDNLRATLQLLRDGFSDAMVTTYTYDPPIGVTCITDPRGRTVYYHYDEFNRLKYVKDHDGNVLNENEYNYAPQN